MTKPQTIDDVLATFVLDWHQIEDHSDDNVDYAKAKAKLEHLIAQEANKARIAAVIELKRRWHDDRRTMDYSPATYDFICDKYLQELTAQKVNSDE